MSWDLRVDAEVVVGLARFVEVVVKVAGGAVRLGMVRVVSVVSVGDLRRGERAR